jgi:hypothetical protein
MERARQQFEYFQTYQRRCEDLNSPIALMPPNEPGNWVLQSWSQDSALNGQFLLIVWRRESTAT